MKIRSRSVHWLLAFLVTCCCRLLFRSLRIHYLPETPEGNPYSVGNRAGMIYSVWHDEIAYPMFAGKHREVYALVSPHQANASLAFGLRMIGVRLVRGSSNRDGARAVREMLRLPETAKFVITSDGPRGPRHEIKTGLVFLASRAQRAIVPTSFAATRCWRIGTGWTDLIIPKPFARVYALAGRPIHVPPDCDKDTLKQYRQLVQDEMDRLQRQAEALARQGSRTAEEISKVLAEQPGAAPTTLNRVALSQQSSLATAGPTALHGAA